MLKEHLSIIKGDSKYLDDIKFRNEVYLYVIRSTYARAEIQDYSLPSNSLLTLTWNDAKYYLPVSADPQTLKNSNIARMPVLANKIVNFYGQPILAIVTEDRYSTEDIAEEVGVDYEPLRPVISIQEALKDEIIIHPELKTNVSVNQLLQGGDLSLKHKADVVVEREIYQDRIVANPMEPKGCIAYWDGEMLTLYVSTQSAFRVRNDIREVLGLSPEKIRVYSPPNVGGGFGNKVPLHSEYVLAAIASMKLKRPVKWIETRREHLTNPTHGRGVYSKVRMYATKEGEILGVEGEVIVNFGAYNYTINPTTPSFIARLINGPYKMKFAEIRALGVFTNVTPQGPYRGAGRPEATLIHETLIEDLAEKLGMDPIEIRKKNVIEGDYVTPLGLRIDAGGYKQVLEKAEIYYREVRKKYKGVGFALFAELNRLSPGEAVKVRIGEGKVRIFVGSGPHGQAHSSTFSKLASEVLNIPMELIEVGYNSTDLVKEGIGSFGSRTTTVAGSAVIYASQMLLKLLQERNLSLEDALRSKEPIELEIFYKADDIFAAGAHVAVVDIDKETLTPKVIEYYAVDDVGKVVIKEEIEGQIKGGVLQGISQVLIEGAEYDENGNPLFTSIADAGVLSTYEVTYNFRSEIIEFPSKLPSGTRGVGESGTMGALASVFIGLEKLLGRKLDRTPVTPSYLMKILG
ncbi:MAG: xanthine dehydrogenase family protein molybdopterin-binding subunit [Sulfolobaceae archaeon]